MVAAAVIKGEAETHGRQLYLPLQREMDWAQHSAQGQRFLSSAAGWAQGLVKPKLAYRLQAGRGWVSVARAHLPEEPGCSPAVLAPGVAAGRWGLPPVAALERPASGHGLRGRGVNLAFAV